MIWNWPDKKTPAGEQPGMVRGGIPPFQPRIYNIGFLQELVKRFLYKKNRTHEASDGLAGGDVAIPASLC